MKIFRDPIHNVINLDTGDFAVNKLILSLIDSKEFQRLRFIKQLSFTYLAYPSAMHTRFEHSLGVAFLAKRFLDRSSSFDSSSNKKNDDKNLIIIAALLHDIGHGPLSHACEELTGINHETWTREIILGKTQVNSLIKAFDKDWPQKVYNILTSSEIISGKLDVDRMDYLLRDSYMTGSGYGWFDLEWLINVSEIKNGKIEVANKGESAAEDFEMAREYMYKNVYLHKTGLAAQKMLKKLFELDFPCQDNIRNVFFSGNKNTTDLLEDYLSLTDIDLFYLLKQLQNLDDEMVRGLADGLVNRKIVIETALEEDCVKT